MGIDWITVSAQIVNFLILVWLLKRFLYQPIIHAMERREQRIIDRLHDADERAAQADAKAAQYASQSEDLERNRNDIMAEARRQAGEEKRQLLAAARQEVDGIRGIWKRQVEDEKEEFTTELRRQLAETVQMVASRALADLASMELEERILDIFIERVESLDEDECKAFADASELLIASAFDLDPALRSRLTRSIHEHIASHLQVRYERWPSLVCGIELTGNGRRLAWNLSDYMDDLAQRVEEAFSPAAALQRE